MHHMFGFVATLIKERTLVGKITGRLAGSQASVRKPKLCKIESDLSALFSRSSEEIKLNKMYLYCSRKACR